MQLNSVCVHSLGYLRLPKVAGSSMRFQAFQWVGMQSHDLAYSSISMHEVPWACMYLHKLACSSMNMRSKVTQGFPRFQGIRWACMQYAVPWPCMLFHDLAYSFMSLHAVPWACIQIQGLRELRSKSYCFFLPKYENYGLFNPTRGSPDVVHLIKWAF